MLELRNGPSLVDYSIGHRPYYEALLSVIKKTWLLKGSLSLLTLYDGFFLLKFLATEDYKMDWSGGPLFFFSKLFILHKWSPEYTPKEKNSPLYQDKESSILLVDIEGHIEVGYSIGHRLYYEALLSIIKKTWSLKGSLSLLTLDDIFFLLKFTTTEDYEMAWSGGPWFSFSKSFILHKYTLNFTPKREIFPSLAGHVRAYRRWLVVWGFHLWSMYCILQSEFWQHPDISQFEGNLGSVDLSTTLRKECIAVRIKKRPNWKPETSIAGISSSHFPPLASRYSASSPAAPLDWKALLPFYSQISHEFSNTLSHNPIENFTAHFSKAQFNAGAPEWSLSQLSKKSWLLKRSLSLLTLDDRFFFLKFSVAEDYEMAWSDGPWFFFGKPFLLHKWTPDFTPIREEFPHFSSRLR
ncbi:hypothetical protein M5K25_000261 [Dendrobium thyrsiflorum]|uniref:DUF4283 domain-containing protein n=1 Tax=Dendrobium thyrsiflorum TaxID=117978 RepID=A0ABD0VTI2_DENTH